MQADVPKIDAVIMDEAGCVLEMGTPVLLLLGPSDMILLGDHKQLPAFSAVGPEQREGAGLQHHCRLAGRNKQRFRWNPAKLQFPSPVPSVGLIVSRDTGRLWHSPLKP